MQENFHDSLKKWVLVTMAFVSTMLTFINMGCITAATPDLSGCFVVGVLDVSWSGAACPLGMTAALTISSYLWSRLGLRRSLRFALGLMLGGAVCALVADHFLIMIAARFLQGFGGGMALVYGTGLLNVALPKESLKLAQSLKMCSIGLASCSSPVIGSFLVQYWDWRAIFVIVALLSSILLILNSMFTPDYKIPKSGKFDWFSFIMILFACLCIIMVLINGETDGWTSFSVLAWLYGGFSAFVLAAISCLTHKSPLLEFRVLANYRFLFGLLASLCNIFCVCWIRSGTVQYMRNVMGYEPIHIAMVFLVLVLSFSISATILIPFLLRGKIALRVGMMAGLIGFASSAWFLSRLNTGSSWVDVAWPLTLFGVGYAFCINIASPLAIRGVPAERSAAATRTLNAVRYMFICMYSSSVSTVLAHMKTEYHFQVAEQALEGSPRSLASLSQWHNHFSDTGSSFGEAQAGAQSLLNKAISLQSQVFSADYFYICTLVVGAAGVLFAFLCIRATAKTSLLS